MNENIKQKFPKGRSILDRRVFLLQSAVAAGLSLAYQGPVAPARRIDSSEEIRVGLIGREGGHSGIILRSVPRLPKVSFVAYAKGQPEEDLSWIQRNPAFGPHIRIYDDFQEMLAKEDLHVVGVCLPFYRNAGASLEAARRGIHVLSEKPAATEPDDLDRLEAVVRRSGVRYSIMINMRVQPALRAARQAVQEGLVGEPTLLYAQRSYRFGDDRPWYYARRETYGGTIPWVGIHSIDSMRWVSGQEFAAVAAHHGNRAHPQKPGCEDHAGLLFRLVNGGSAVCNLDYLRPQTAPTHGDNRLRVAGTEGVIEVIENDERAVLITRSHGPRDLELPPPVDFFGSFVAELRGEGSHVVGPEDAISVSRICLHAREAADRGEWVKL